MDFVFRFTKQGITIFNYKLLITEFQRTAATAATETVFCVLLAINSVCVCVVGYTANNLTGDKKLSYCWETVRRESMPRIAEMDVEMTT